MKHKDIALAHCSLVKPSQDFKHNKSAMTTPWAFVAELWKSSSASDGSPRQSPSSIAGRPSGDKTRRQGDRHSRLDSEPPLDQFRPRSLRESFNRKQLKFVKRLKRRDRYAKSLDRGLRLGHEICLKDEDKAHSGRRLWSVTYKTEPKRPGDVLRETPQEEFIRISWTSEHKGDTALVAYKYNTRFGHSANWMLSGSGGPLAITSRGELGGGDFEQENDLTIRSEIHSHPVETDLRGAIRINYLTDNVAFNCKGAIKYPILRNAIKLSHGIEKEALYGCCWVMRAEKTTEELPWKAVRMETSGPVSPSSARIEHIKAELIRNLSGPFDLEFEAKAPFTRRALRWSSKIKHRKREELECAALVDGEDSHCQSLSVQCKYQPTKAGRVSCSAGFQRDSGLNVSTELQFGEQNLEELNQRWNLKAGFKVSDGFRRRQADVDLFVPL